MYSWVRFLTSKSGSRVLAPSTSARSADIADSFCVMCPIEWKEARPAVVSVTDENRRLGHATVLAVLTAGVEGAAGRERDWIRRTTGQSRERKVTRRVEAGDGLQERLGIGHPSVIEEFSRRALLDDLPRIHHCYLVGVVRSEPDVVA